MRFQAAGQALLFGRSGETVRIEPWGPDAVRVRATVGRPIRDDLEGALGEAPDATDTDLLITPTLARLTVGQLMVEVDDRGVIRFLSASGGDELLAEEPLHLASPPARHFSVRSSDLSRLEARFLAYEGERCYGLGQHQHGLLDQKGCVVDLEQRNSEVSIPFLLSSRGYGFLWNNPAVGRVELGHSRTRWIAEETRQLDYWVVAGQNPSAILNRFADVTGHAPDFPEWATGFWQSKLRYVSQQELLEVAREHRRRELPMSVIVADFLHWRFQGDWAFDPAYWPDPAGLVRELGELGIRLMVSIWPGVNAQSTNYPALQEGGLLMRANRGLSIGSKFVDTAQDGPAYLHFYDPSNPEARTFIWNQVQEGYHRHGINIFWLDANEPELLPSEPEHWSYFAGSALEVGNLYPRWHAQAFYEGLRAEGETEILSLSRSAWAGSQRYGTAVWSGDVKSTFESLRAQLVAGLNIGLSGIPWWGSDIGGFSGQYGTDTQYFRELVVRWFQFAAFTPVFRLHGHRRPDDPDFLLRGAPNEIWHFGDEAYEIIKEVLQLRERLRPYLQEQLRQASATGVPPMRPLFVDFPGDPAAGGIEDQFMLGPDILVAPVLDEGIRQREVYLPAGTGWADPRTGDRFEGGQTVTVPTPLSVIPVFLREGASVRISE